MHLFISYAKKDTRDLALALTDAINGIDGLTAWVDKTLRAGKSWELQIQSEIDRCDTMIVLYSPDINRHKSGQEESYVLTEIHYAKRIAKKRIIPVMAVPTDPPMSLALEQYIDFTIGGLKLTDLINALCDELGITVKSAPATSESMLQAPPTAPPSISATDSPITRDLVREALGRVLAVPPSSNPETLDEALERARNFTGKHNRDWTPFITTFPDLKIPDMTFCLVPVGAFQMGTDQEEDEKPIHSQTITKPYWIAQYPVTNAQWALAVKAGAVAEPRAGTAFDWYREPEMVDAPVIGVTWYEIRDFVAWMGCRLLTELKWEYAARGIENCVYPWGNDWEPEFVIWKENSGGRPRPVTSVPEGASWVGAYHMSGNVWEWTSSAYTSYPYKADDGREGTDRTDAQRVLRGGSWYNSVPDYFRTSLRYRDNPGNWHEVIGFRVAHSVLSRV